MVPYDPNAIFLLVPDEVEEQLLGGHVVRGGGGVVGRLRDLAVAALGCGRDDRPGRESLGQGQNLPHVGHISVSKSVAKQTAQEQTEEAQTRAGVRRDANQQAQQHQQQLHRTPPNAAADTDTLAGGMLMPTGATITCCYTWRAAGGWMDERSSVGWTKNASWNMAFNRRD
jgi:hypothetical protein